MRWKGSQWVSLKVCDTWKNNYNEEGVGCLVLQQSSMQGKNKYVSSLDLKYLDAKFIAIHDSHLEISTNINEIRKSKTSELPSILHSKLQSSDDTTLYTSAISPTSRLYQQTLPSRHQSIVRPSFKHTQEEMKEVEKYKKMIAKIKSDNELIHKEITNLYRQEKLITKQPKKKPVRAIIEVARAMTTPPALSPPPIVARQYERLYEDLGKGDKSHQAEALELQKKFQSSNFYKNFESFLLSHNRRVPEFIKKIR